MILALRARKFRKASPPRAKSFPPITQKAGKQSLLRRRSWPEGADAHDPRGPQKKIMQENFGLLLFSAIRTRRIGANPEKSDLVNFRGPTRETLVNSVFCCFCWEKSTKCSRKPGLVNEFSATPRGQLNWTGPIANSSDYCKNSFFSVCRLCVW